MIKWIKKLFKKEPKCEHCGQNLRRNGDKYYGGVDIHDTIGGPIKRTAYICNLCYEFYKRH